MKKFYTILFVFSNILYSQIEPITGESTFKNNENTFKIKYKVRDAKNVDFHGQIIAYSVYVNNKFVHPINWDGGKLSGCRQPFTDLKETYNISVLGKNNNSVAWMISTRGWCGRGGGWKNLIILPSKDGSYYKEHNFISSVVPTYSDSQISELSWDNALIIDKKDRISILYKTHQWDEDFIAMYLTQKVDILPNYGFRNMGEIIKGDIYNDILAISKNDIGLSHIATFASGLMDLNIRVMEYSLNNLYESKEQDRYSRSFGDEIDVSKEGFQQIIDDAKSVKNLKGKLNKNLTDWTKNNK